MAGKPEALRWVCSRHCGLAHIYTVARYHFRNCTFLWLHLDRNKHGGAPGTRANEWSRRRTAFPGLAMIVIGRYWEGMQRIGNWKIPSSGVVAAFIFMLGHIGYKLSPFAITHFSLYTSFLTFTFSLYYAYVFHRTGSLLGPIISHGYWNLIVSVLRYSMAFLFG